MTAEATLKTTRPRRGGTMATHEVRTRDGGTKRLRYGRKKAIQLACVECLGWEHHPKDCTSPLCPLFPYRGQTLASQNKGKQ